ncbi:MAG: EamA family transporter [Phycisphaeraceae bacterium]
MLGVAMLVAATGAYAIAATGASGGGVDQWWGIGMFAGAMLGRSVLALLLKDVLRRQDSQAVASLNALVCTIVLAVWAAARWGVEGTGVMPPQAAGWSIAGLLIASGLVGIWTGVALNNWLVSGLGLVRMHLSICAVPPVVAVAGWLILGEAVGLGQLACGVVILACVAYLMRLKNEPAPDCEDATGPAVEGPVMDGPALPVPPVPEYVHDCPPPPAQDPSRR